MKILTIISLCIVILLPDTNAFESLSEKNSSISGLYVSDNYITYSKIKNGSVKGIIDPAEANVIVTVTADGKSYQSKTNAGGEFFIENIPEGTYAISFSAAAWIYKANLSEVVVTSGMITDLGIVNVSQP